MDPMLGTAPETTQGSKMKQWAASLRIASPLRCLILLGMLCCAARIMSPEVPVEDMSAVQSDEQSTNPLFSRALKTEFLHSNSDDDLEDALLAKAGEVTPDKKKSCCGGKAAAKTESSPRGGLFSSGGLDVAKKYITHRKANNIQGVLSTMAENAKLQKTGFGSKTYSGKKDLKGYFEGEPYDKAKTKDGKWIETKDGPVYKFQVHKLFKWWNAKAVFTVDGGKITKVVVGKE